jgi:putative hydrolase of the HAD superfamily
MKYEAVIFDLFGTLIRNFTVEQHEGSLEQVASILAAPAEGFIRLWYSSFKERCTGILQTTEDNIDYVCRELGVEVDDSRRSDAARIRYDLTRNSMVPFPDTIQVLSTLKSEGYRTGLVSDCSSEVPAVWQETPFAPLIDVAVFSCSVGIKKPDPGIYHLAAERLAVRPEDCLYIGDGSSNELTGAAAVGMHPVLLLIPEEDNPGIHRINYEGADWKGPVIQSLSEVLTLVE